MGKRVNLGGKRLGSGNKMTVQMKNFGRSSHDQGFVFTTDQAFGTLVPCLTQIYTRGDTVYLDDITSIVRTLPTTGPVFGSVKQQIDVFVAPIRLYIGALHNNATGVGLKMDQVKMPLKEHVTTTQADDAKLEAPNRASVSKTSLESYLGLNASPWCKAPGTKYYKNALFELMYWDIYKCYYANKQEEVGYCIGPKDASLFDIDDLYIDSGDKAQGQVVANKWTQVGAEPKEIHREWRLQMVTSNPVSLDEMETSVGVNLIRGEGMDPEFWTLRALESVGAFERDVWSVGPVNSRITLRYTGRDDRDLNWWIPKDGTPATRQNKWSLGEWDVLGFPLSNIDDQRADILKTPVGEAFIINGADNGGNLPYTVSTIYDPITKREAMASEMCGLALKTHLSDIFNNWLQTDWLDGDNGINELTSVEIVDGKFTMDELNFKQKLFNMMNRIAIQDGSYDAWQTAVYGATGPMVSESPIYVGGYSAEIAFDEVVSTAASGDEALGSLAGRGATQSHTRKGGRNIKIKCTEACLVMAINSFTPRVTYSQGNEWWTELKTMDDLHKPDLDGIAFQVLPTGWMQGTTERVDENTSEITSPAAGKQPSWVEYTTAVNKTFGSFATGGPLQHMVFNRPFRVNPDAVNSLDELTTYINPTDYNIVFADKKLTALPFWVQIGFNLTSRRVMSASQMPIM